MKWQFSDLLGMAMRPPLDQYATMYRFCVLLLWILQLLQLIIYSPIQNTLKDYLINSYIECTMTFTSEKNYFNGTKARLKKIIY